VVKRCNLQVRAVPDILSDDDPAPVQPVRPSKEDCCEGACYPCIFDPYEEMLQRYGAEVQAWGGRAKNEMGA
jgi:hypothetical protein